MARLTRSRPPSAATTASRPGPGGNGSQPRLSRSTAPKTRRHQANRTIAADPATYTRPRHAHHFTACLQRDGFRGTPSPSVTVRGKPTVTPTARQARTPSAIRPWTPQYDGLQRDKVKHSGTEQKRPA